IIPNPEKFIEVHILIMESDDDIRRIGNIVDDILKDEKFLSLIDDAVNALEEIIKNWNKVVINFNPYIATGKAIMKMLAIALKKNGDDEVATIHELFFDKQAFGLGRHPAKGMKWDI
ncbi:MAG: hypothetical protein ACTSXU_10380, partial [Promethearchaeota archaeon]